MEHGNILPNLIGDRVLLTQYADLLSIFIEEESWTELRQEMGKSLPRSSRVWMPGFKSAEIIQRPDEQKKLTETPCVIARIQAFDGRTYEWEASLQMSSNRQGFITTGQIHMVSEPNVDFLWSPQTEQG